MCLGNICRSPSAEAVMKKLSEDRGLELEIDSAGIIDYHAGEVADSRMRTHAVRRGYELTSVSRPVISRDFEDFDMIIGMDDANIEALLDMASSENQKSKIFKMSDFCSRFEYDSVPDPYYGGSDGFELVLDLLEDACAGLLDEMKE